MSSGTPYIGSKISLISKAEIRYEGILYAVDTKEATVTLAKVRSFGTEDRAVPKHIPPRNETYEFIIFRGSDIKDLHVSEFPKQAEAPQDPAILSAQSVPPPTSTSQSPSTQTHPSPHTHPPPHNSPYNPFPPPAMGGYSPFGMPYFRPPMMMGGPGHPHPHPSPPNPPHSSHPPQQVPSPIPASQPLPIMQPVPHHPSTHPPPPSHTFTPPPPRPLMTVPPPAIPLTPPASMAPREKPQASSTPQTSSKGSDLPTDATSIQTVAKSSPPEDKVPIVPPPQSQPPPLQTVQPKAEHPPRPPSPAQPLSQTPPTDSNEPMVQQKPSPPEITTAPPQGDGHKNATEPLSEDPLNTAVTQKRRQPNNYRSGAQGNSRGYRGRKDNHYRGGPPRGGGKVGNYSSQPTYRYDSEFDFESANARFNKDDLEEEFKQKVRVEDGGVVEGERRVSENSPPETLPQPEEEEGRENDMLENGSREGEFYDKSKSFFDNISCELNTAGNDRRPRWNKERELNTETFGVSSVYSRGYRGRRGGWRGGWRGRGGYGGRGGQRGGNRYYGNQREYGGYGQPWGGRGAGGSGRGYYRGGNSKRKHYAAADQTNSQST